VYRSIGEEATLGRGRGIARVFGLHVRGRLGALITRAYHVSAVPVRSRRLRILADGLLSTLFRRDIAELGTSGPTQGRGVGGSVKRAWRSAPTATR
jgi:NADH dehydrogenase